MIKMLGAGEMAQHLKNAHCPHREPKLSSQHPQQLAHNHLEYLVLSGDPGRQAQTTSKQESPNTAAKNLRKEDQAGLSSSEIHREPRALELEGPSGSAP